MPEVRVLTGAKHVGHLTLQSADFTRSNNTAGTGQVLNTQITADTPTGLLAGHLVKITGDGEVGVCGSGERPVGINIWDVNEAEPGTVALGTAEGFLNQFAEASGRITYVCGQGAILEVNVYETHEFNGGGARADVLGTNAPLAAYAAGQLLASSENGLLTNEDEVAADAPQLVKNPGESEVANAPLAVPVAQVVSAPDADGFMQISLLI